MEKKTRKEEQYDLSQEILNETDINIVTCGMCGSPFLHRMPQEELQCPDCGFKSDPADFPDLFNL